MAQPSLYRRLRAFLSPFHPRRFWGRAVHLAHRMGYFHVRLWVLALHPRRLAATVRWARAFAAERRRRRNEPRLTVAVDVSAFWEPLTGVGWYLYRLLEHLAERDDLCLRLYGLDFIDKQDMPPVVEPPTGPAIEVMRHRVPEDLSVVHYYFADQLRHFQVRLIAADGNRVLFAPNYFLPPWFSRCEGRLVATVHDLSIERVPETMRETTRREQSRHLRDTLERAAWLLTDSETVREELIATGLADPERVTAVHLGPAIRRAGEGEPEAGAPEPGALPEAGAPEAGTSEAGTPEAGIPGRYALHVGTLEPRKDLPTLFSAWRELRRRWRSAGESDVSLVLCGGFGWKTEELRREMANGLEEGWIRHLGYVEDERVAALYRGATVAVLPSIYEGFGLPALEAMSAGVPLVCSDIPVFREVAGEAALYAPPRSPLPWADRLAEVLADGELRAELARRGRRQAARFDWRKTADETARVWRMAAERGDEGR